MRAALATLPLSPAAELLESGFCTLPALADPGRMAALSAELDERFDRTPFCEGLFSGSKTKRFHALFNRCNGAAKLALDETILEIVEEALLPHCDTIQLNLTQAIEIYPGELPQVPHRDQNMWGGPKGEVEYLVNVMWPLTPFQRENGATRVWPRSHRRQDQVNLLPEEAETIELFPGDALLFLGSTLHAAGANRTALPRRGIIISYSLGWLKPYENMSLTYPPHIARHFPPRLQQLVGYCRHRPNLGNYDGNCPSILLQGEPDAYLATRDDLLEAQEAAIERYRGLQAAA